MIVWSDILTKHNEYIEQNVWSRLLHVAVYTVYVVLLITGALMYEQRLYRVRKYLFTLLQ